MRDNAISLDERFTDVELARMFNVEVCPDIPHSQGERRPPIEERYCFNDIKVRLWTLRKRAPSRGERKALQSEDYCTISHDPPGSAGRLAALIAHYEGVDETTQEGDHHSAFNC